MSTSNNNASADPLKGTDICGDIPVGVKQTDIGILRTLLTVAFDSYLQIQECPTVESASALHPSWKKRSETELKLVAKNSPSEAVHFRIWIDQFGNLFLAFRGTDSVANGGTDINSIQASIDPMSFEEVAPIVSLDAVKEEDLQVLVHRGFWSAYLEIRMLVSNHLEAASVSEGGLKTVFVTGHSLGGALATLAATDIAQRIPGCSVECVTFGAPPVGNQHFKSVFEKVVNKSCRVANKLDLVPRSLSFLNSGSKRLGTTLLVKDPYCHTGYPLNLIADCLVAPELASAMYQLMSPSGSDQLTSNMVNVAKSVARFHGLDVYSVGLEFYLNPMGGLVQLGWDNANGIIEFYSKASDGIMTLLSESTAPIIEATKIGWGKTKRVFITGAERIKSAMSATSAMVTERTAVTTLVASESAAVAVGAGATGGAGGWQMIGDIAQSMSVTNVLGPANFAANIVGHAATHAHLYCIGQKISSVEKLVSSTSQQVGESNQSIRFLKLEVSNGFSRIDGKLNEVTRWLGELRQDITLLSADISDAQLNTTLSKLRGAVDSVSRELSDNYSAYDYNAEKRIDEMMKDLKKLEDMISTTFFAVEAFIESATGPVVQKAIISVCEACLAAVSLHLSIVGDASVASRVGTYVKRLESALQKYRKVCSVLIGRWMLKHGKNSSSDMRTTFSLNCGRFFAVDVVEDSLYAVQAVVTSDSLQYAAMSGFVVATSVFSADIENVTEEALHVVIGLSWFIDDGASCLQCLFSAFKDPSPKQALLPLLKSALSINSSVHAKGFELFVSTCRGTLQFTAVIDALVSLQDESTPIRPSSFEFDDHVNYEVLGLLLNAMLETDVESKAHSRLIFLLELFTENGRRRIFEALFMTVSAPYFDKLIRVISMHSRDLFAGGAFLCDTDSEVSAEEFSNKLCAMMKEDLNRILCDSFFVLIGKYLLESALPVVARLLSVTLLSLGESSVRKFLLFLIGFPSNLSVLLQERISSLVALLLVSDFGAIDLTQHVFDGAMRIAVIFDGKVTFLEHCTSRAVSCLEYCAGNDYFPAQFLLEEWRSGEEDLEEAAEKLLNSDEFLVQQESADSNVHLVHARAAHYLDDELYNLHLKSALRKLEVMTQSTDCPAHILTAVGCLISSVREVVDGDALSSAVLLTRAAALGHVDAMANLADCYYEGNMGHKATSDDTCAVEWYNKAAIQGHARAQEMLGDCFFFGEGVPSADMVTAVKWYQRSAKQQHFPAMTKLADCYLFGYAVAKDEAKALELYRTAAAGGNAAALVKLGDCYAVAWGVEEDQAKWFEYYTKASECGTAAAAAAVMWLTEVSEDDIEAKDTFLAAAALPNHRARHCLHGFYYFHEGSLLCKNFERKVYRSNSTLRGCALTKAGMCCGIDSLEEAAELYREAAELGSNEAQNRLGDCYFYGRGVDMDFDAAMVWYKKAADDGDAIGQKNVGCCYQYGYGVTKNPSAAFHWYKLSAGQGCAAGEYSLAYCFEKGFGTSKDKDTSKRLYRSASEKGYKEGVTGRLGRMFLGKVL